MRTSEAGGGEQPLFGRRPRVAEVAARAGVSTATVDRVINARGGVRKKTVALVEKAIREIAAVDRGKPAHAATFDIFLPANSGRSTEVLAEAVIPRQRGPRRAGQHRVRRTHESGSLANQLMDCAHSGSSGVAVQALDHPLVSEAFDELARAGIPVVTVCSDIGDVERLAYIGIDNRAAGRTAGFLMGRFCRGAGQARRRMGRPALPQPRGARDRLPHRAAPGLSRRCRSSRRSTATTTPTSISPASAT